MFGILYIYATPDCAQCPVYCTAPSACDPCSVYCTARSACALSLEAGIAKHCLGPKIVDLTLSRQPVARHVFVHNVLLRQLQGKDCANRHVPSATDRLSIGTVISPRSTHRLVQMDSHFSDRNLGEFLLCAR